MLLHLFSGFLPAVAVGLGLQPNAVFIFVGTVGMPWLSLVLSLGLGFGVVVLLAFCLYSFLSFIYFEGLPPLPGKKKILVPDRRVQALLSSNFVMDGCSPAC